MSATATSNVLITGGTSGIGLELARHYVRCGHRVVVVGRRKPDELAEPLPHDCVYCQADLSKSNATEIVLQILRDSSIDCLDLLIHNAAVGFIGQPTDQLQNSICELLATNLMAPIELSHACLPLLSKGHFKTGSHALKTSSPRCGKIVFVSSVVSRFASPDFAVYAATKAAAVGLTRSCAAYYAPQGVRFNLIAPALVATPMSQRAQEDDPTMKYVASKQPLDGGRIGKPEDLDAAVTFFLSDESKFVTGQILSVDGGWSVSEGQW